MDNFLRKIDKTGSCWNWNGFLYPNGYGGFHSNGERYAHRHSYKRFVGPIAHGMHVDHLCRNRKCVNPDHLQVVTPAENIRRGVGVGRVAGDIQLAKTHCPRGHEYAGENLYKRKNGNRQCRTCRRDQAKSLRNGTEN